MLKFLPYRSVARITSDAFFPLLLLAHLCPEDFWTCANFHAASRGCCSSSHPAPCRSTRVSSASLERRHRNSFVRLFVIIMPIWSKDFNASSFPVWGQSGHQRSVKKKIKNCAHRMFILLVDATKNVYAISKYRNFSPFLFYLFISFPALIRASIFERNIFIVRWSYYSRKN